MTAPRECSNCGTQTADTVGVVVSHGRAPVDGVDLCRACDAERCELQGEPEPTDMSLIRGALRLIAEYRRAS